LEDIHSSAVEIAPIKGVTSDKKPWEGSCQRKPWEYKVTAVIPCLDTSETLPICIELLRLQTERPYIVVIDTGSDDQHLPKIEALRAEDVEVHLMRLNGTQHPSDFPAMAMDFGFTLCRTEYLFATHADCFLRRRDFLTHLISKNAPVVGYQITPRAHSDWLGMVSHTATLYHMPVMDQIGFGWSLRRLCHLMGIADHRPNPARPNWPDTEILGNYILRHNKITPVLIGSEKNFTRQVDENIDHFRSFTSSKLYSPGYHKAVQEWFKKAKTEALERIEKWKNCTEMAR
jgi:glycosyltransferase involved in cell wall biosynthesis